MLCSYRDINKNVNMGMENESSYGKVMENEKLKTNSWNFVISHEILQITPDYYFSGVY